MKHDFIDKYSGLSSPVHRLDPRAKLMTFFIAIVIIASEPRGEIDRFIYYYGIIVIITLLSRIPLVFILKRFLIASPFILAAALLLPISYSFTESGSFIRQDGYVLNLSLSIILKGIAAIVLLTLITSTSKFHRTLAAFRSLKFPKFISAMASLMYRYIFILNDERLKTSRARESRTPGKPSISRFKIYGNQAAMIFLRSYDRSRVVYQSMLSRGYTGELPVMYNHPLKIKDILFTLTSTALMLSIRMFPR